MPVLAYLLNILAFLLLSGDRTIVKIAH